MTTPVAPSLAENVNRSASGFLLPVTAPPPPPKPVSRVEASKVVLPPADSAASDANKFPGGVIPTKLPPRLLSKGIKRGKR